ncbi:hypothetical protein ILUMI_16855, partial [Ignelater luminosus]
EGLDKKTFENEINEWSRRDTKGQEILVTRMEEGPMGHVLSCSTAFHMWNKLLAVYEKKSEVNVHLLQQKFFNCKHEGEEVAVFFIKNRGNSQPAKANGITVPDLKVNLFSIGTALDQGYKMTSDETQYIFTKIQNKMVGAVATREGKLYKMNFKKENDVADIELSVDNNLKLWHEKLAHQNFKQVKRILKKHNVEYETNDNEFCEACIEGKRHREPFGESTSKIENVYEMVRADLCGPIETSSIFFIS